MGKRLSAREERVMKDKDTFEFEVETLTGGWGVGQEPSIRGSITLRKITNTVSTNLEHSFKKAGKLQ
jgi:hypothetical protein